MMHRKHFKAIAEVLQQQYASTELVMALANVCEGFNGRFDQKKFLQASGIATHTDGRPR